LPVRSRTLPPASHTNAWLFGDEDAFRLLVDPSPADESAFEALWQQVQGRFDLVFLTHHHPDHRERADALARRAGVPLAMSADTQARIAATQPAFFDGLETWIHAEGEIVTRWNGHLVRALAVPGHDAGQLALMPENRAWCLVGDLIQGIGTVVIAPPEGDMAAYFASLQRIIDLDPKVVLPSHGSALGGTHYLAQALAHRREREAQILELHRRGLDEDALLATIYRDVPPGVLTLARLTIRSHLAKLRAEGAIDAA
jgi:Zn-dependent hydrolases, including glyoxylases